MVSNYNTQLRLLKDKFCHQSDVVDLQVGERHFTATRKTLTSESDYFRARLTSPVLSTKALFVDADPDLFEDVLRYLRHGVMPLFYDRSKGHDVGRYRALAAVADYLGVVKLAKWLKEGKYVDVVGTRRTVELHRDVEPKNLNALAGGEAKTGLSTTVLHPRWSTKRVYRCPYSIPGHAETPDMCREDCPGPPAEADRWSTTSVLDVIVVREELVVAREEPMVDRGWPGKKLEGTGRTEHVKSSLGGFPGAYRDAEAATTTPVYPWGKTETPLGFEPFGSLFNKSK